MALPISFRWEEEFVARIDAARGDTSRSAWIRRACEQRLDGRGPLEGSAHQPGPDVVNVRSSAQAKRGVAPIEKGGK